MSIVLNSDDLRDASSDEESDSSIASATEQNLGSVSNNNVKQFPSGMRQYYAVRAGYAAQSTPTIKIKSAIFLHWEDARIFIDSLRLSFEHRAEYEIFRSIERAEEYLIEGERQLLSGVKVMGCASGASGKGLKSNTLKDAMKMKKTGSNSKPTSTRKRKAADQLTKSEGKKMSKKDKYWDTMFKKLVVFKRDNRGSIDIPEINKDSKRTVKGPDALRKWLASQSQTHRNTASLTTEQIEKLRDVGVQLPPSWDDMYERLAQHQTNTGTLEVKKGDDEELFEWVKVQKTILVKHFLNKPVALSNERLAKLKSLGFAQSRPGIIRASGIVDAVSNEAKWNAKLEELKAYKERNNGSTAFPEKSATLPVHERSLKYWVTEQRREFKKLRQGKNSNLTAQRIQRLTEMGLELTPRFEVVPWEQRIESLKKFVEEHGHCRPPKNHPELGSFVSGIRQLHKEKMDGKKTTLTDERVNELTELGFVFQAGKTPKFSSTVKKTWDERFQELLEFKEIHGHTIVPQLSGPLGGWVRMQRVEYKRYKAGRKSNMTAEKALKLTEIGFCFDASARFSGSDKSQSV